MTASAPVQANPEGTADENSIPKARVDVMMAKATASADAKAAAAEARANTLEAERQRDRATRTEPTAAPPPATSERVYTRDELQTAVDAGQINQAQMDTQLESQMETRVETKVAAAQDVKDRGAKIGEQISQYLERVSDINDPASDNHKRLSAEVAALHKLGYAQDATTELQALRTVIGPIDKVKIPEEGPGAREVDETTHTGGGGEQAAAEEEPGSGPLKGLSKPFVEHYQKGINQGRFSGWGDEMLVSVMKRELAKK